MTRPGQSAAEQRHKAARQTLEHYEAKRRAAVTERERWIIAQAIDEARARLRLATRELEKEAAGV